MTAPPSFVNRSPGVWVRPTTGQVSGPDGPIPVRVHGPDPSPTSGGVTDPPPSRGGGSGSPEKQWRRCGRCGGSGLGPEAGTVCGLCFGHGASR